MSKVRNPRVKKKLTLTHDHRVLALEGTKTFRKKWPRKKAQAKREVRRAEQVALGLARAQPEEADVAVHDARATLRRRRPKKVGVLSLGESLEIRADRSLRWGPATHTVGTFRSVARLRRLKASR
jgi:hypothetical protein